MSESVHACGPTSPPTVHALAQRHSSRAIPRRSTRTSTYRDAAGAPSSDELAHRSSSAIPLFSRRSDLTDPRILGSPASYSYGWRQAAVAAGGRAGGCGCRRRLRVQTVDGLPAGARGRAGRHAQHEALGTDSCGPWRGMHVSHVCALTLAGAGGHGLLCQQFKCTATA